MKSKNREAAYKSPVMETIETLVPCVICASQASGGTESYKGGSTEDWYSGSGNANESKW